VYRFRDAEGRVIYVGKAKNLRNRLNSYFQDQSGLHPRTRQMVNAAANVEWTSVATEVEALALEYTWIKQFEPRFNIKFRDDKSYPYLCVSLSESYPRAQVSRSAKRDGDRYFGPFPQVWAIRQTLDCLLLAFPIRSCSQTVFQRSQKQGRPCLLGHIAKCAAPCIGRIDQAAHRELALELCRFMAGDQSRYITELEKQMRQAASALDFEQAARLRDQAAALTKVNERNVMVLADGTNCDVFGFAQDHLEACAQLFVVREGRVRSGRGWFVEKVEDLTTAQLVAQLLQQVYGDGQVPIPPEILLPTMPWPAQQLTDWLQAERGSKVVLRVPQRGEKKELVQRLQDNAEQSLHLHKLRRSSDLTARSEALRQIEQALGLAEAPLRIECYDISTTQGTHQVASMVVFEDGLARKAEYRRFAIRGGDGQGATDDTAAIHEVISRRFARLTSQLAAVETSSTTDNRAASAELEQAAAPPKFAYRPHLVLVDGGAPQVAAAARALAEQGQTEVALAGLAKRLEEVYLPGQDFPVILPRASQGLYLLQRLRDEAHRFAITYHRQKRSKAMTAASLLDSIAGVGASRRQLLLRHFGSLKRLRTAQPEEIAQVKGIGPKLADEIWQALHR
jgi:excinuclease ABC subunit C